MFNQKTISTDFKFFGTFLDYEVSIFKPELEKKGIPVKVLYTGARSDFEPALLAWAMDKAYQILLRENDFDEARKILERFNIKPRKKIPILGIRSNIFFKLFIILLLTIAFVLIGGMFIYSFI